MGDRPCAGWDCCHNPGQGEGLDNIHLMSKGGIKLASRGLWAVQGLPQFSSENNIEKQKLPQTTIIIRGSISTTMPIFVPIQKIFNFTTKFTTNYYHKPLP